VQATDRPRSLRPGRRSIGHTALRSASDEHFISWRQTSNLPTDRLGAAVAKTKRLQRRRRRRLDITSMFLIGNHYIVAPRSAAYHAVHNLTYLHRPCVKPSLRYAYLLCKCSLTRNGHDIWCCSGTFGSAWFRIMWITCHIYWNFVVFILFCSCHEISRLFICSFSGEHYIMSLLNGICSSFCFSLVENWWTKASNQRTALLQHPDSWLLTQHNWSLYYSHQSLCTERDDTQDDDLAYIVGLWSALCCCQCTER